LRWTDKNACSLNGQKRPAPTVFAQATLWPTAKLALGCLSGPQAQSVCGATSCATMVFGQTEASCVETRNLSPAAGVMPAVPATAGACVGVPGTSLLHMSVRCTASAENMQCQRTMAQVCGDAKRASAGNCFVCCGSHQAIFHAAGCTNRDFSSYCAH
jgi:hypothetical protein